MKEFEKISDFFVGSNEEQTDNCGMCPIGQCDCYDDFCCYDPRYTGKKGTCRCAEWHKEEERSRHWFFKRYDFIYYNYWMGFKQKIKSPFFSAKRFLFSKTQCTDCGKKSFDRNWNGFICPKCGETNLPF